MNKKGFTTVELILTILLVAIIMFTITNVTSVYRDRSDYEKILTDVTNYKNMVTRIIYDDILSRTDPVAKIERNGGSLYEFNLVTKSGRRIPLTIDTGWYTAGIVYDNVVYEIPGSKDGLVTIDIETVSYKADEEKEMYSLDIMFRHQNLEELFRIHFAVTGDLIIPEENLDS